MGLSIKGIAKILRQFYLYLFKVRGVTLKDELRLLAAMALYVLELGRRGKTLGYYILGSETLKIKTWDNYIFNVRPRTTDLGFAALTLESYELNRWFVPNVNGVVIDVGANIGGYTVRACRQADFVIAIEPQKEVFELLKVNVENNCNKHNVILLRKAIGDKKGKAILKIPMHGQVVDSGTATLSCSDAAGTSRYKYEEVEVDTLDNIVESLCIDKVDFIKVDIEGAEAIAFKGMKCTLGNTRYLMIEIHHENEWLINELRKMKFKLIDRKGINYFFAKAKN